MANVYRIKSIKWTNCKETNPDGNTVWWRANSSGYTSDITQAGIYTEAEVQRHRQYHSPQISEIIPVEVEVWSKEKIHAKKTFLTSDEVALEDWEQRLKEAEMQIKLAKESIQSLKRSIRETNMELTIQARLNEQLQPEVV